MERIERMEEEREWMKQDLADLHRRIDALMDLLGNKSS